MSLYTLEAGEYIYRLKCECCGKPKKRVFGFVSKDNDAHAVYYALLNVTEDKPRVGLTVSVGPWWENLQAKDLDEQGREVRDADGTADRC